MGATPPAVVVHPDRDSLAAAVARKLAGAIGESVSRRGRADIVLTGGGVGTAVLGALRTAGAALDWSRVHVWWGDERFLPAGDADRNETQARAALLDHVAVDPANVHAMPAVDHIDSPEAAAAEYAALLSQRGLGAGPAQFDLPRFDVLLLGVGDDGHVASLFPGHPGASVDDSAVIGVHGSPKPPPLRVSLTMPAITSADQVWLLVAGAEKAPMVAAVLTGARPRAPAARATGRAGTVWFLDEAAAIGLADT